MAQWTYLEPILNISALVFFLGDFKTNFLELSTQDWILIEKLERAAKLQETNRIMAENSERADLWRCACNKAKMVQDSQALFLYLSSSIYWFSMCCVPLWISACASVGMTHSFPLQSLLASVITDTGFRFLQFYTCHPPLLKPYSSYGINQNMRHVILSHLVCQLEMKQWVTKPVACMGGTSENVSGYGQSLDITEINCLMNYRCGGLHI